MLYSSQALNHDVLYHHCGSKASVLHCAYGVEQTVLYYSSEVEDPCSSLLREWIERERERAIVDNLFGSEKASLYCSHEPQMAFPYYLHGTEQAFCYYSYVQNVSASLHECCGGNQSLLFIWARAGYTLQYTQSILYLTMYPVLFACRGEVTHALIIHMEWRTRCVTTHVGKEDAIRWYSYGTKTLVFTVHMLQRTLFCIFMWQR